MKVYFRVWLTVLVLALGALAIITLATQPACAAGPRYVAPGGTDSSNDCTNSSAPCATIQHAVDEADPGDTIYVATGTYTGTGSEVVLLDKNATLSGGWDGTFSTQSGTSTIDGEDARRGITVNSGVTAMVERFAIQNGSANDGGGIFNHGTGTLNNSTISGNTANSVGGGIYNSGAMTMTNNTISGNTMSGNTANSEGGGIYNIYGGTLTLNNSTISGNTAGHGSGISNDGTLTLNNSTVSGNTSNYNHGGGIFNDGTVTLNNSTITGNTVNGQGGGIDNYGPLTLNNSTVSGNTGENGGGIYNSSTLTLTNSTVSGNTALHGGGIFRWYGVATLNNSTVSGNTATWTHGGYSGGGIYNNYYDTMTLQNTIVAGNTGSIGPDCSGSNINSSGYNLIGRISGCTFTPTDGDLTNTDAKLGPLEGSLGYHPLLPGSPAINAGNPGGCMGSNGLLTTDQRGFPRFNRCDIGAYEMQPIGFSTKAVNPSTALPGDPLTYTIALNNAGATDITNVWVTDALPIFLSYISNSLTATSGGYGYNNGVITWTGSVNAGGAVTITFRATVSPTLGFIVNSAVISGGGEIITRTATVTVEGQICNPTKHTGNPVLSVGAGGSWDDDDVWGQLVLKEGSSYKMWYTGDDGSNPSRIGLATSANGITWTKSVSNPVLSPGLSWETGGIRAGSVISDSGLYKMWYTGYDSSGVGRIGYATSPDGVTWTKYGGNPVLNVGTGGNWEDDDVVKPTVIKEGSTYHLWYTGDDGVTTRIGHATSSNGTNWTKDLANPVLDLGPPGGWDWLQVYGPNVVAYNGYLLWYSGGTLPEAWQTGYALSSDGSGWTRQEMLIPEGPSGSFDADSADYPSVIVDGTEFKVWYSGLNDSGTYNVGYATAEICSEPSPAPPANPVYLPIVMKGAGAQPSCPAYYTDDFSDPDSGWPVGEDSKYAYGYISGQYQIRVKTPPGGFQVTPGAKATDFVAAVSARRTSGTYGAYGIHFGINEDWSQYYEVVIDANYYSIWRYDGTWTPLRDWTTSGHINTGTGWNRLKVIRDGADIAFYVNNQHLATVTDSSFTGLRRIGLYAGSGSALDARFDDFSLYPASCGPSAAGVGFEMGEPGVYEAPAPPGLDQSP